MVMQMPCYDTDLFSIILPNFLIVTYVLPCIFYADYKHVNHLK